MRAPNEVKFRRVLLKISGEALMGSREYGLDPETIKRVAAEVKAVNALGIQVCLVIGGGNIFRGVSVRLKVLAEQAVTIWECLRPS